MASQPPAPAAEKAGRPYWTWLGRLVRVSLVAIVLYVGWRTFLGYREMLSGPRPVKAEEIDLDEAALFASAEMLVSEPGLGSWVMAGLPFEMTSRQVSEAELEDALMSPLPSAMKGWPVDKDLRGLLNLLKAESPKEGDRWTYHLAGAEQRVIVFTRKEGEKEVILGGRLARKAGADWTVIEVLPGAAVAEDADGSFLLPLPRGTRLLAQRQDDGKKTIAQFCLVPPLATPRTGWEAAGWQVRSVKGMEDGKLLVCHKAGVTISAWHMPAPRVGDASALLLVRLPKR